MTQSLLTSITSHVYIGRDNPTIVLGMDTWDPVAKTLTPIDWTGVARMVLTLTRRNDGTVETIDTAVNAVIDYTTNGQLTFTLGPLAETRPIAAGTYEAELTSIDGASDETIHISRTHPTHRLAIQFHSAVTI